MKLTCLFGEEDFIIYPSVAEKKLELCKQKQAWYKLVCLVFWRLNGDLLAMCKQKWREDRWLLKQKDKLY